MDNQNLKVIQLNINSIVSLKKRSEFKLFLSKHKPDVVLINETRTNAKHKFAFTNYNTIRNDRQSGAGGGTAILIKSQFKYNTIPNPKFSSLETTIIKIILENNNDIYVASVYNAPKNKINNTDLNLLFDSMSKPNSALIVGGDFNSLHQLWNNKNTNKNGEQLYNWYIDKFNHYSIKQLNTLYPTHIYNGGESFLDFFFISNNINPVFEPGFGNQLKTHDSESDHKAVELIVNINGKISTVEPVTIPNYSNTDWKAFNTELEKNISNLNIPIDRNINRTEIDTIINKLNTAIEKTISKIIPTTQLNPDTQIPLSTQILKLIKEKKRLRRQLHRNINNRDSLKSQISCLDTLIRESIGIHYKNYYNKKIGSIKCDNDLYKKVKRYSSYKNRVNFPPLIDKDSNSQYTTPLEKAEALANQFEAIHKSTLHLGNHNQTETINNHIKSKFNNDDSFLVNFSSRILASDKRTINISNKLSKPPIHMPYKKKETILNTQVKFVNAKEISKIIKTLNNKKSFGPDNFPNFLIRKTSEKFHKILSIIINHCLNIAYFPDSWKLAKIIPLIKPNKDPNDVSSYRPIALLSCLGKIFEKVISKFLQTHNTNNKIIQPFQFGFQPGLSCNHALTKFSCDITENLNNKIPTIACAIDSAKAFDTIWHEGLIYKMKYLYGYNDYLCKLIYNYCSDRKLVVNIENQNSSERSILAGAAQGSILAPSLYCMYIADLPLPSGKDKVKTLLYADDILVYHHSQSAATSQNKINEYLHTIYRYLHNWKIAINAQKSQCISIAGDATSSSRKYRRETKILQLKINNTTIPSTNNLKYLGLTFSRNYKFHYHVKEKIEKTIKAYMGLKSIFNKRSDWNTHVRCVLYKSLLRPIITHAFPIWSSISSAQMEKIRRTERKLLRAALSLYRKPNSYHYLNSSTLYKNGNTKRIDRFLIDSTLKFLNSLQFTDNNIISELVRKNGESPFCQIDKKFKNPFLLKHLYDNDKLFDGENKAIHYHRAFNINNRNLVYTINQ